MTIRKKQSQPLTWQKHSDINVRFAEIYLNQTNKRIDRTYDYAVLEKDRLKIKPGMRVVVPFGKGNRHLEGFVVNIKDYTDYPDRIRAIEEVIDQEPVLNPAQIVLCLYLKQAYCSLFYEALHLFTNPVKVVRSKAQSSLPPYEARMCFSAYDTSEKVYHLIKEIPLRGHVQKKIISMLQTKDCTRQELTDSLGNIRQSLLSLVKKGCIETVEGEHCTQTACKKLPEATEQIKTICREIDQAASKRIYLNLNDPDDKLSVYLQRAAAITQKGRSVLMLFPELYMVEKANHLFAQYFGSSTAVYHGDLTQRERCQTYKRIRSGHVNVLLGTRAALFMPLKNLGLIILDEERDPSYYAVSMPRYDTLETAVQLARLTHAELIVSDEIPSIRMLNAIDKNRYTSLPREKQDFILDCKIVDMQQEMKAGNFSFISRELQSAIDHALLSGQKAALLLNRQGYASYVFCRSCGYVETCPVCGVSLKYYAEGELLKCPYCGYSRKKASHCPQCGATKIREMGLGIDQAEAYLKKTYQHAKILKLSASVLDNKQQAEWIDHQILEGDYDILLGTRILLKNFSFKQISVAGALLVDSDFNHGDYSDTENAWQLYGRFFSRMPEHAQKFVQTYEKEHAVVSVLNTGDLSAFYNQEMQYRKFMGYPPVEHLIVMSFFHEDSQIVYRDAQSVYTTMTADSTLIFKKNPLKIYEPFLSGYIKRTGKIRYRIIIKTSQMHMFYRLYQHIVDAGIIEARKSKVAFDINPPATV